MDTSKQRGTDGVCTTISFWFGMLMISVGLVGLGWVFDNHRTQSDENELLEHQLQKEDSGEIPDVSFLGSLRSYRDYIYYKETDVIQVRYS